MIFLDYNDIEIKDAKFVRSVADKRGFSKDIYEKNHQYITVQEDTLGFYIIIDKNKIDFLNTTIDFIDKGYYYYNYKLWEEFKNNENQDIDPLLFKC